MSIKHEDSSHISASFCFQCISDDFVIARIFKAIAEWNGITLINKESLYSASAYSVHPRAGQTGAFLCGGFVLILLASEFPGCDSIC